MGELIADVVLDAVIDTARLLPFLYVTYLIMEALEQLADEKTVSLVARAGAAGPAVGGILGVLPQCGFSAAAATLYAAGVVTMGTVVSTMLSTSDEMVPIFLAHGDAAGVMVKVIVLKMVLGIIVGFAIDFITRSKGMPSSDPKICELCEAEGCGCGHDHAHHDHEHGHEHGHSASRAVSVLKAALHHSIQVAAFIFAVSLVLGFVMETVGEEPLAALSADHPVRATVLCALVGLIPNCASSVAVSELYLSGAIGAGPLTAGLLSASGVGMLVLWRTNRDVRQNAIITGAILVTGICAGLIVGSTGLI